MGALGVLLAFALELVPTSSRAELPNAPVLLASLGVGPGDIARVEEGQLVHHEVKPASERELTAGLDFEVPVTPTKLVEDSKRDLLDRVDPNQIAYGVVSDPASPLDFARLTLPPVQAKAYLEASAGGDLNLSSKEIAAFHELGSGASPAAVADLVRHQLLARVQAYRELGLAGIASYARGGGKQRSPAEELRTATLASKPLLSYPSGKPPGTQEVVRWSQFEAHGVPTIALTQVLLIPDGDAWIVVQRQFYVSSGYNAEQALAAFLLGKSATVVVYANRTSTDQITGFGGGMKRSLGSQVLASQLETLFEKARAAAR
jgi:hypothetical protein